jgi:hypothetical protein
VAGNLCVGRIVAQRSQEKIGHAEHVTKLPAVIETVSVRFAECLVRYRDQDRAVLHDVFPVFGAETAGSAMSGAEQQLPADPVRTGWSSAIIGLRNLVRDQGVGLCLTPCSLNGDRKEADRYDREQ